eukprot:m.477554 g.477554  ORF g.477554 m.477554 type:complete len:917 (+) comp20863_c0_seq1:479-3229(+)
MMASAVNRSTTTTRSKGLGDGDEDVKPSKVQAEDGAEDGAPAATAGDDSSSPDELGGSSPDSPHAADGDCGDGSGGNEDATADDQGGDDQGSASAGVSASVSGSVGAAAAATSATGAAPASSKAAAADTDDSVLPKKKAETWTNGQSTAFFEAIVLFGRDFDKLHKRIKDKNRDQIRHFYYRSVRRVKGMLAPLGLNVEQNNHEQELRALSAYWELRKRLTRLDKVKSSDPTAIRPDEKLHKSFPKLLLELLRDGTVKCRKGKKNITIVLPDPQPATKNGKQSHFHHHHHHHHPGGTDIKSPRKDRQPEIASGPMLPNPTDVAGRGFWKGVLEQESVVAYCAENEEFLCRLLRRISAQKDPSPGVMASISRACRTCTDDSGRKGKRKRSEPPALEGVGGGPLATTLASTSPNPSTATGSADADTGPETGADTGGASDAFGAVGQSGATSPLPDGTTDGAADGMDPSAGGKERLTVAVSPSNNAVKNVLQRAGREPYFNLSVPCKKTIPRFMNYLRLKFEGATQSSSPCSIGGIEKMRLFLDERSKSVVMPSEGWGWESTDKTLGDLRPFATNGVVRIMYSWPTVADPLPAGASMGNVAAAGGGRRQSTAAARQTTTTATRTAPTVLPTLIPSRDERVDNNSHGVEQPLYSTQFAGPSASPTPTAVLPDFLLDAEGTPPGASATTPTILPSLGTEHSLAAPSHLFEPSQDGSGMRLTDNNHHQLHQPHQLHQHQQHQHHQHHPHHVLHVPGQVESLPQPLAHQQQRPSQRNNKRPAPVDSAQLHLQSTQTLTAAATTTPAAVAAAQAHPVRLQVTTADTNPHVPASSRATGVGFHLEESEQNAVMKLVLQEDSVMFSDNFADLLPAESNNGVDNGVQGTQDGTMESRANPLKKPRTSFKGVAAEMAARTKPATGVAS